jgi:hypothetical protein
LTRVEDRIPIIDTYRGVGIHDSQPPERIERVVKREIDHVLDHVSDIGALFEFARDHTHAPEARLLAAAKIEAEFALAVEERRSRPTEVTIERTRAVVAGLNSKTWRSRTHYAGLDVTPPGKVGPVPREVPLPDKIAPRRWQRRP